jgi:hypothetical protein
MQEALAGTTCDEGTWIEVAPVFGLAEAFLERSRRMIECDPLNFYHYFSEGTALLWLDQPAAAHEAAQRGLARTPGHPFLEVLVVKALVQQGRLGEALAAAESMTSWARVNAVATVLAAQGNIEDARSLVDGIVAAGGAWQEMYLTLLFAAIVGDRATANEAAAWYDGLPGGPLMLSGVVLECLCGAPFDISETPQFAEGLAEAGVDWPPPVRIDYPAMREAVAER